MKTVKFTEMKKGSKEDYELLAEYEKNYVNELPDRILESLKNFRLKYISFSNISDCNFATTI